MFIGFPLIAHSISLSHSTTKGHGDTEGNQYTPKLLEILSDKRVVAISACGFHTACLTDTHELYTWGEGTSSLLQLKIRAYTLTNLV